MEKEDVLFSQFGQFIKQLLTDSAIFKIRFGSEERNSRFQWRTLVMKATYQEFHYVSTIIGIVRVLTAHNVLYSAIDDVSYIDRAVQDIMGSENSYNPDIAQIAGFICIKR